MRYLVGSVLFLGVLAAAFGQNRGTYSSLGGYGNVLFPGTGHAPATPPNGIVGIAGGNFGGRFGGPSGRVFANPFVTNHPQHQRAVIVPYPVFYGGGYGYGYDPSAAYAPGYADQAPPVINSGAAPSVVINQNFIPQAVNPQVRDYGSSDAPPDQQSGMRLYQNSSHPYADAPANTVSRQQLSANDQPTIYLIAFKDHSIVQALGYWMEGATLHYVSVEHSLNQASIDLIDRDLSQRLNDERGLEFRLPK
jgi:hypothetical protein